MIWIEPSVADLIPEIQSIEPGTSSIDDGSREGVMTMSKIYKRSNLVSGVVSKKKDEKARKRNVIMNFRVSEKEKKLIDQRIALSGLSRADYFISSCMNNSISVSGNVKTFDAIREAMKTIDRHLCEVEKSDELDVGVLDLLRGILEILNGFYGDQSD